MNPRLRLILSWWIVPMLAQAATLRVGPADPYPTIQGAIAAAAAGDTIEVAPGIYPENLVLTKPLALRGARAGDDARGRVTAAPDPLRESIIAPAAGVAVRVAAADGPVALAGWFCTAAAGAASGVVVVEGAAADGLMLENNHLRVAAGAAGAALRILTTSTNADIRRNVFEAAADSWVTVGLDAAHTYHGLCFSNNHVRRSGAAVHFGLWMDGERNVGPSGLRRPMIEGNVFCGHGTGLFGGGRSLQQAGIMDNTFTGNGDGMAAGPLDSTMAGNAWTGNSGCGLRLGAFGRAGVDAGAHGNVIERNEFSANGSGMVPGQGDLSIEAQVVPASDNRIHSNKFASAAGLWVDDPSCAVEAAWNYWGAADGPSGAAVGSGAAIGGSGSVVYEPYYANAALTSWSYGSGLLTGEVVVAEGQSIVGDGLAMAAGSTLRLGEGARLTAAQLTMPAGSNLVIQRGSAVITHLMMDDGAVLDVVDGNLSLDPAGNGEYHTIGGSFTFFNCLGSLHINGNTTFSGATLGLASDIHVLSGSTMLVLGSLVLDGCRLDSNGTFSMMVNTGASLAMRRCEVKGAAVSLVGSDVALTDNIWTSSSVTAFSTVNGARIYHNVFNGGLGLLKILPGAVVTTSSEGWSNVSSPGNVQNELALRFRPPLDPTRTLDAQGNLFVQPGDVLDMGLDIARLNAKTQAVEVLLGCHTGYLQVDSWQPTANWSNVLYEAADETKWIGKINSAIGLAFELPDRDGTQTAGPVADLRMRAQSQEGLTRVFFREREPQDGFGTRLTVSSNGVPSYKEHPFSRNGATLTVDGTAPEFGTVYSAIEMQANAPVDVLQSGVFTRRGVVTVTFDVMDRLAGIDAADVSAELVGTSGTLAGTPAGTNPVVIDGTSYTRHVFTFAITNATPDGIYDVNGKAMDRSGNLGVLALGALEVVKNQLSVMVQPQGLISGSVTRDVVFTATDSSGAVLTSWTVPVVFTGGSGPALLERVPDGTAALSAKMSWNLRVRLPVTLNESGVGSVAFTGSSLLRGGDFNGDNIVNLGDYNLLRAVFPGVATVPDITGDGYVNVADYNILRANWLTGGAPP